MMKRMCGSNKCSDSHGQTSMPNKAVGRSLLLVPGMGFATPDAGSLDARLAQNDDAPTRPLNWQRATLKSELARWLGGPFLAL